MSEPSGTISSSLDALSQQYRLIAHNLANASTPGYKRRQTAFAQLLDEVSAAQRAAGEAALSSTVAPQQAVDFSQGMLTETGSRLDLALEGGGFFVLETPDGPLYTRAGQFRTNAQGQLVDLANRLVAGTAGPIVIPPSVSTLELRVSPQGQVTAAGQALGQIQLVEFDAPSLLEPVGSNCYRAGETAGRKDAEATRVHQGFYESSNVSVVEELVGLITVTRLYEANLKSISVQDERMKQILDVAMS